VSNLSLAESHLFWKIGIHSHRWIDSAIVKRRAQNVDECAAISYQGFNAFVFAEDGDYEFNCFQLRASNGEEEMVDHESTWVGPDRNNTYEVIYWRTGNENKSNLTAVNFPLLDWTQKTYSHDLFYKTSEPSSSAASLVYTSFPILDQANSRNASHDELSICAITCNFDKTKCHGFLVHNGICYHTLHYQAAITDLVASLPDGLDWFVQNSKFA